MTQWYLLLGLDLLLSIWCVFWGANEDFNPAQRWVYGIAATILMALFALGVVQGVFGGN